MEAEKAAFQKALQENVDMIANSKVMVQIYHDSMQDFLKEPWPVIQLACAIMLDKPIVLLCPEGRKVPSKLKKVADKVITGNWDEIQSRLQDYFRGLENEPPANRTT